MLVDLLLELITAHLLDDFDILNLTDDAHLLAR